MTEAGQHERVPAFQPSRVSGFHSCPERWAETCLPSVCLQKPLREHLFGGWHSGFRNLPGPARRDAGHAGLGASCGFIPRPCIGKGRSVQGAREMVVLLRTGVVRLSQGASSSPGVSHHVTEQVVHRGGLRRVPLSAEDGRSQRGRQGVADSTSPASRGPAHGPGLPEGSGRQTPLCVVAGAHARRGRATASRWAPDGITVAPGPALPCVPVARPRLSPFVVSPQPLLSFSYFFYYLFICLFIFSYS